MKDVFVWYSLNIEGFHMYPNETIETYLQNMHRHIFKCKVSVQVFDNDREIEFIRAKRNMETLVAKKFGKPADFGTMSCEAIGEWILSVMQQRHGHNRKMYIEVSEDGENGSVTWYESEDKSKCPS